MEARESGGGVVGRGRSKSRPSEEEWTPNQAAGLGGVLGWLARRNLGASLPAALNQLPRVRGRPPKKSGQPYQRAGWVVSMRQSRSPVPQTGRLPRSSNWFSVT